MEEVKLERLLTHNAAPQSTALLYRLLRLSLQVSLASQTLQSPRESGPVELSYELFCDWIL